MTSEVLKMLYVKRDSYQAQYERIYKRCEAVTTELSLITRMLTHYKEAIEILENKE